MFLTKVVRNVLVCAADDYDGSAGYLDLLSRFPGTANLALQGEISAVCFPALTNMRLRKFTVVVPVPVLEWATANPLLRDVMHLGLFLLDNLIESTWQSWRGLASVPAFTHLAITPPLARRHRRAAISRWTSVWAARNGRIGNTKTQNKEGDEAQNRFPILRMHFTSQYKVARVPDRRPGPRLPEMSRFARYKGQKRFDTHRNGPSCLRFGRDAGKSVAMCVHGERGRDGGGGIGRTKSQLRTRRGARRGERMRRRRPFKVGAIFPGAKCVVFRAPDKCPPTGALSPNERERSRRK
ncbi:hypothetical protein B0H11DRAFT_1933696 [Mycena galericulata]|nr:hypothetical protein B0H11DRAFT_1933696 [Mycena galericulata]